MAQRLEKNSPEPHRLALRRALRVAGGEEHLDRRLHDLGLPRQLHAVHAGHDDVGEQQIDMMLGENTHGIIGVGRGKYAKPLRGQHADDDIAHRRLVFDEENGDDCCHGAHRTEEVDFDYQSTLPWPTSAHNLSNNRSWQINAPTRSGADINRATYVTVTLVCYRSRNLARYRVVVSAGISARYSPVPWIRSRERLMWR